jgi:hypothetical protein
LSPPAELPVIPGAGDQIAEFDTSLGRPAAVAFDTRAGDVWVSDVLHRPAVDHRLTTSGVDTGDTVDTALFGSSSVGALTYNRRTGMLWQVGDVGLSNCIHEVDPVAKVVTGKTICLPFQVGVGGVAYNPITNTYYVGGQGIQTILEVDEAGRIVRDVRIRFAYVSGLAFNPNTGHLFVQTTSEFPFVWVLDVNTPLFDFVTGFPLAGRDGPAYGRFEGAGIALDCAGHLWSANPYSRKIFVNKSGEAGMCLPWLTATPQQGTVSAHGLRGVKLSFDTAGQPEGCREAQLLVGSDTPYDVFSVPVGFTVAYKDVPPASKSDKSIHGLATAGVVTGCAAGRFCPAEPLTRSDAAAWLLRSKLGGGHVPPVAVGLFTDVPASAPGAAYVEEAYNSGILAACSSDPPLRFCPSDAVTRAALATALLKAALGPAWVPPSCTGIFQDISCSDPGAPWVENAFNRGWMNACLVAGNKRSFCPTRAELRATSAEEDARAFAIPACPQ